MWQPHLESLDSCFWRRHMCCWIALLLFGTSSQWYSAAGAAAFKPRHPPPETNGSIGHTTKTLVCVPVRQSTCRADDLPSELMAKTACLKREKHVILIMNVKGFTACFGWRDRNWGIITCLSRTDFFSRCLAEFKMEMREWAEAQRWKNTDEKALKHDRINRVVH